MHGLSEWRGLDGSDWGMSQMAGTGDLKGIISVGRGDLVNLSCTLCRPWLGEWACARAC